MMGADRLAHLPVGSFGRYCLRTFEYPLYPRKRIAGLMATALILSDVLAASVCLALLCQII
jgi:hypothetical protein